MRRILTILPATAICWCVAIGGCTVEEKRTSEGAKVEVKPAIEPTHD